MAAFVAHHGLSASDQQSRVDELAPQGFQLASDASGCLSAAAPARRAGS